MRKNFSKIQFIHVESIVWRYSLVLNKIEYRFQRHVAHVARCMSILSNIPFVRRFAVRPSSVSCRSNLIKIVNYKLNERPQLAVC